MRHVSRNITALLVSAAGSFSLSAATADTRAVTFEEDVRPILKANCFHCHGEEKEIKSGLDLRLAKLIQRGGKSGAAITPGDHTKSLLHEMVATGEMPPKEEHALSKEDIATIAAWIDAGAPTKWEEPREFPKPGDFLITAAEREHWAFRPITKPATAESAEKNPIDTFIDRKLRENGLTFSEPADRRTLLRRAAFALTGLPPAPEDVDTFLKDESPEAWEKAVDRLLASPHYGERWGRHWLDVAGYADSDGYNDKDNVRDDAWMYRDYVTRSLNADKPWDRFIVEQLAGDELVKANAQNAETLANANETAKDCLTATGFLRMAPDGTGSAPDDPILAQHAVITETVKVISSSLLGLTVGCAECHHHRFDPIPQEDFYRMRAVLAPVYNMDAWKTPDKRKVKLMSAEDQAEHARLSKDYANLLAKHDARKGEVVKLIFGREVEQVPAEFHELARKTFETVAKDRTPEQVDLFTKKYPALNVSAGTLHLFLNKYEDGKELMESYESFKKEAEELKKTFPQPSFIRVATEVPEAIPATRVFYRGDPGSPEGDPIQPAGLAIFKDVIPSEFQPDPADLDTSGRRLAWAEYLTSGKHPLVARVLVNRFWLNHFGQGIVDSPGDFGVRANPPTHPELLDWLAADFMEHGWKLKRLHKLILTSRTWQQSSERTAKGESIDAQNRLLWRMPVRRLEAEIVRDSILAVSGQLNREISGEPVPVTMNEGGVFGVGGAELSEDRRELKRSIYIQVRRTQPVPMLEAFDAPQMEPNCEQRLSSTVATQSLTMMNGEFILSQSEAFADRVMAESKGDAAGRVDQAWRLAFGSAPSEEERGMLTDYLTTQTETLKDEKKALATLCQVLLASNHFLYVD